MVRREVVIVEDDLDGSSADETVRFGLDGAEYEIDLSGKNARKFRKRLAPFVEHAHRVAAGQRRPARTAASRQRSRDIRAWARQQGIELSDRGRMPASIVDQYEASTSRTARRLAPSRRAQRRHGSPCYPRWCPVLSGWGNAPSSVSRRTASALVRQCSFCRLRCTCISTVRGLRNKVLPICLLVFPGLPAV